MASGETFNPREEGSIPSGSTGQVRVRNSMVECRFLKPYEEGSIPSGPAK